MKHRLVFESLSVAIGNYRCRPHGKECSPEEHAHGHEIVFVRAGMFAKHVGRRSVTADAHSVIFFNADEPYRVSHPVPIGDDCTVFTFAPDVVGDIVRPHDPEVADRPERPFRFTNGPSGAPIHLAHQAILGAAVDPSTDPLEIEQAVFDLAESVLSAAFGCRGWRGPRTRRADTDRAHRDAVDAAKAFMAARATQRLRVDEIARAVHVSPFHLCRVFRRETGLPMHRYVNGLRLRAALDRLAGGREDLTAMALDLGYSSYNHFSTSFRREFGLSPGAFRRSATALRLREMSKIVGV